jgi:hypothetical protein
MMMVMTLRYPLRWVAPLNILVMVNKNISYGGFAFLDRGLI